MHRIILIRCDDSSVAVIIARTIFLFLFALFARVLYNPMALPLNTDELRVNDTKQKSSKYRGS